MPSETLTLSVVEAIKADDEKVLKALYKENYGRVLQYVLQNSGSEPQAKDVFQEAFIVVWRNIQTGKFNIVENTSLSAYLFQVARYKWLDQLRSSAVKKTTELNDCHTDMMTFEESNDIDSERIMLIKKNFKKLGNNCRDLLSKFYYRKQSLKEIASVLNITEATAKNQKYRCMERLRAMINH
ncbi:MAG TPA: sigma-70 family RNA polymerase sigma factor [Agriterribacter sp.]|nr:sigma-70 family RNA polymerase sigma factor [Agriterribacter sp.]